LFKKSNSLSRRKKEFLKNGKFKNLPLGAPVVFNRHFIVTFLLDLQALPGAEFSQQQ